MIEDPAANDHAGVVINDHDHEGLAGFLLAGNSDGREISRVGLPGFSEFIHLECTADAEGTFTGSFHSLFLEEPLDCPDAYRSGDEAGFNKALMDGDTTSVWIFVQIAADFIGGIIIDHAGCSLVLAALWHQPVHSVLAVVAGPSFQGVRTELVYCAVRKGDGIGCYAAVVCRLRGIRKSPLDNRSDHSEAEVGDFHGIIAFGYRGGYYQTAEGS